MRLSKAARHALLAAIDMARSPDNEPVTVTLVARRNGIPEAALAKVLQRLVRAGLAVGVRGVHGGYRLARPPSQITILDVLDVFEPIAAHAGASAPGAEDRVGMLFGRVDEHLRATFSSLTLDVLARDENATAKMLGPGK